MLSKYLIAFVLFAWFSENALPAELVLQFSGTLEGVRNCEPASDTFCGRYTGVLHIDDGQVGRETAPFSHDYTADVVIEFAGGQTASCRAQTPPLPETYEGHLETRMRYCLISVSKRPGNFRTIQLSFNPLEEKISFVSLVYEYEAKIFDIRVISQVLGSLLQPPTQASFLVTGHACSWGPCVDLSVTRLTMPASSNELE